MKDRNLVLLITVVLLASISVSAFILYKRINAEKSNNRIELAADFSDIERASVIQGITVNAALSKLKSAGISAVALTEDIASSVDMNLLSGIDPKKTNLYIPGKGLSSKKIGLIRSAGLRVIPRIRNSFDLSGAIISRKIKEISSYDTVIFSEEEVLGYPNYLRETAQALRSNNMKYGFVEFGKQTGDAELAAYMGGNLVKVHGIPPDELENMSGEDATNRFVRAARERGVRIIYVHLIQYSERGKDLLSTNVFFIEGIKKGLLGSGFAIGEASMPAKIIISRTEKAVIGLGIAAGAVLLIHYFMPVNLYVSLGLMVLFALFSSKLLALLSAVIFPAYAVISMFPAKRDRLIGGLISRTVLTVICVAAVTAVGAVFIAALLAEKVHMIGIDAFSGIKLALILPLLIVAAYFFLRKEDEERLDIGTSVSKAIKLLDLNVKVYHAVIFLVVAGCGVLFILRSGNFGLPVLGPEKYLRGLLENLLVIRPRTKEFLIGYPALMLGSIYYFKSGNKWLWFWLSIGVLAPISMINSFCHIHTPLMITLVRSCVGMILGITLGLLLYLFYVLCEKVLSRIQEYLK